MSKTQANAPQAVITANQKGLNGFDDVEVVRNIVEAHKAARLADKHNDAKAAAAFQVCREAQRVRSLNASLDNEAWASSWRASMKGIYPALFAAKVTWVEQTEQKLKSGDVQIGYKLTSYGRNISSDALQVGMYEIDAEECGSLQAVRKAIKAAKEAEAVEAETDDERKLREARETYLELLSKLDSLLADAESIEAYAKACETVAEMIVANTPIEVPEQRSEAA